MNEAIETKAPVMSDTSTVEKKIESIIFNTLKERIRGHIYIKMQEKTDEKEIDTLNISINNYGVSYTDSLKLPGDTYEMVSKSDSYAQTLALMIFDNYKKYIDTRFFIEDRQDTRFRRYNKKK